MFGRGWRIGSIGGVPITLDSSWVWIAIPITYSLYLRFAHRHAVTELEALGLALLAAVLFFGSVLAHELAHAGMARARGVPVFGIRLLFWGGATEVPADRGGATGELLISAVGPASNGVLAVGFWALSRATAGSAPAAVFGYAAWINGMIAALNVLPGYPLDGGQMLRAALWRMTGDPRRADRVAGHLGVAVGILAGVGGALMVERGQLGFGIWLFFIGWFLIQAARGVARRGDLRGALARGRAADAMRPPPPSIPAHLSLSEALDRYLRAGGETAFPVVEDGRVVGVVSFRAARRVGARDPLRPVRDGMVPLAEVPTVPADLPLDRVAEVVGGSRTALVFEGGRLVGQVSLADVAAWAGRAAEASGGPGPPASGPVSPPPPEPTPPPRPDTPP